MLICSQCGKIIANTNSNIHYGICSSCPIPHRDEDIEREPTTADEYNDEWLKEQKKDKKECCNECSYWDKYIINQIILTVSSVSTKRIILDPNKRIEARYWIQPEMNTKGDSQDEYM